jgi:hypothetical protein
MEPVESSSPSDPVVDLVETIKDISEQAEKVQAEVVKLAEAVDDVLTKGSWACFPAGWFLFAKRHPRSPAKSEVLSNKESN